jgi:hypothetical protein
MFDWFKNSEHKNVVSLPFPRPVIVPTVESPKKEEEHYSIGVTNDNRITLRIGYTTLTMNRQGVENLIQQLAVFRDQLEEEHNNEEEDNA